LPFPTVRIMSDERSVNSSGPDSVGAEKLEKAEFESFLENAVLEAQEGDFLGALVLARLSHRGGRPLDASDMERAASLLTRLGRQVDVMASVGPGTFAMVLTRLASRTDVHVMLGRVQDFFDTSEHSWVISTGVGVFPLCGGSGGHAWEAACRDLEGALSSESWVHEIPRETIRTRRVG